MELFPAIDLRGGRVVRLLQGDYDVETAYDDDPVARARSFAAAGARWIHVVDLDAARTGSATNLEIIGAIAEAAHERGVRVQSGGGVRDARAATRLVDVGVDRVVVGTAAVESPELVDVMVREHGDKVAVGLDARGRAVAVRGWTEDSGIDVIDLATRFDRSGIGALIVTQIDVDGTLEGPDVGLYGAVLASTSVDLIASGGVGSADDVSALAGLEVDGRGLAGVIIGKALYEERLDLKEALARCSPSV